MRIRKSWVLTAWLWGTLAILYGGARVRGNLYFDYFAIPINFGRPVAVAFCGGTIFLGTSPYVGSAVSVDLRGAEDSWCRAAIRSPDRSSLLDTWSMLYDSSPFPPGAPSVHCPMGGVALFMGIILAVPLISELLQRRSRDRMSE